MSLVTIYHGRSYMWCVVGQGRTFWQISYWSPWPLATNLGLIIIYFQIGKIDWKNCSYKSYSMKAWKESLHFFVCVNFFHILHWLMSFRRWKFENYYEWPMMCMICEMIKMLFCNKTTQFITSFIYFFHSSSESLSISLMMMAFD